MGATPDFSLRPHRAGDLPEFVRVSNAANEADGIDERSSEAGLANWLLHPRDGFIPADDIVVAEVDGRMVAYGWVDWVMTTDGRREYRTRGHVDPAWRRRGLGSAILAHNEARLRQIAMGHPDDLPRVLGAFASEHRLGGIALITGAGYRPVRYFFDMLRPHLDDVDLPPMPDGLELRPVADREGFRRIFDADAEAFMDHWGGFDASDAAFNRWLSDPYFDPSLFVIAWDGDEIAGVVINAIDADENKMLDRSRGVLDSVFVRRPWRRRGLAAALVARSLILLRERGMTSAWLGVDAENPTGALGVYERAGFVVHMRSTAFHKPLVLDR